jgi:GDP-mannose transporter
LRNLVTATTFTVLGVMNKVVTVLMSYLLIAGTATFVGVVALFACIGAGTMYEQAPPRASEPKTTGRRWGHSDMSAGAEEQGEMEPMLGGSK